MEAHSHATGQGPLSFRVTMLGSTPEQLQGQLVAHLHTNTTLGEETHGVFGDSTGAQHNTVTALATKVSNPILLTIALAALRLQVQALSRDNKRITQLNRA